MKSKRINSPRKNNLRSIVSFIAGFVSMLVLGLPAAANPVGATLPEASVHVNELPATHDVDMRDAYESKRMAGIVMAGILAPVFGGITTMGTVLIYRKGLNDDGGFCTVMARERDDDYRRTCEGDRGEIAGIILVSSFGGILTLAMLVSGVVKLGRSSRGLRRLALTDSQSDLSPLRFRFAVSEREVSFGFSF